MFNPEKSIADWRKQMLKAGVEFTALTELENHLREDIERQIHLGLTSQQAFEIAAEKIGKARELKGEFKKVGETPETRLVKLIGIACVVVASLFSAWIALFLFNRDVDLTAKIFGLAAFATTILSWKYNVKFLPVLPNRWIRAVVGFICCFGCVLWIQFFIVNIMPHVLAHPGTVTPRGQMLTIFLWGWTIMAVLGGVGFGLEKAARKSTAS